MAITPKAIISGIGASIFVLLVSACGADSTVPQAPTAVAKLEAQAAATLTPTAVPTATTIPTPTATPLPTPTLAPTATATPRLSMIITPRTPTPHPTPTPTPVPDLDQLSQNRPPHIFVGAVLMDGLPAPDGTVVRALVNGVEVASVQVEGGKYPALAILILEQTVTFLVGDLTAAQTYITEVGGLNLLNLTATSSGY